MSLKENPQNYFNPPWDMSTGQAYQEFLAQQNRHQVYGDLPRKTQADIEAERLMRESLWHPGQ